MNYSGQKIYTHYCNLTKGLKGPIINLVTGENIGGDIYCEDFRANVCGAEGKYFEEKL